MASKTRKQAPVSSRLWTRGVEPFEAEIIEEVRYVPEAIGRLGSPPRRRSRDRTRRHDGGGLFGDGGGGHQGGGLFGDGARGHHGGGLFGDGGRGLPGGNLFGDGSRNHNGGGLFGLGFVPDRPDTRDHTIDDLIKGRDAKARYLSGYSKRGFAGAAGLPSKVDLADGGRFGRADYQGRVQSCTAHAVTSMAEYIFKLSTSGDKELSRLFLYKISRELLEIDGDRGCTMRETLKALHRYGCMSEVDWPYDHYHLEKLPRITDFERARDFRSLGYARLDDYNADGERTLQNVLRTLAEGFPVAFGFSLFSSIDSMGKGKAAIIPEPPKGERGSDKSEDRVVGAHAVLAVGYEKRRNEGYLRIRNSWGEDWGDAGYAWLPFGYVTRQLACDFWTIYRIKAMDA